MEEELKIDVTTDVDKEWVRNHVKFAFSEEFWSLKQELDLVSLNLAAARAQERASAQEIASLRTRISRLENPPYSVRDSI